MTTTARIGIAMVVVAALVLASATGGVSSVAMDRPIAVEVVSDNRAMVGIDERGVSDTNVTNETSQVTLLAVENRLDGPITVSAEGGDGEVVSNLTVATERVGPGESTTVVATADCAAPTAERATVTVTADGAGVSVERVLEVTPCAGER